MIKGFKHKGLAELFEAGRTRRGPAGFTVTLLATLGSFGSSGVFKRSECAGIQFPRPSWSTETLQYPR